MLDKSSKSNLSKTALEAWQNKVQTDKSLIFPFSWKNTKNNELTDESKNDNLVEQNVDINLSSDEPENITITNNEEIKYITLSVDGNEQKTKPEKNNFRQQLPLSTRGVGIF